MNQKKLGTRISDLECQLGQAQNELKCLKNQLVSAEAAKKAAQEQLDKKSKRVKKVVPQGLIKKDINDECGTCDDIAKETDVFEVPVDETTSKDKEINALRSKLAEREKALEVYHQENTKMKIELHEKSIKISSVECEVKELGMKLSEMNQELEKIKINESEMREKLEESEKAKEGLEDEMKKVRVQTEQWRKAADAAASVLAGEVETNERRISERCGSMDKQYGNAFERGGGYGGGYVGSPGLMEDSDEGYGGGKRKGGGGIRKFGDLWKKKGHK